MLEESGSMQGSKCEMCKRGLRISWPVCLLQDESMSTVEYSRVPVEYREQLERIEGGGQSDGELLMEGVNRGRKPRT
jgi:hypothetical protein